MNIFLKQATRRPLFTTLLVLLLSFSVLLSCTGYSAWESAKTQKNEISNGYTTIAIPIEPDLSNLSPEEITTALQNRVSVAAGFDHCMRRHRLFRKFSGNSRQDKRVCCHALPRHETM